MACPVTTGEFQWPAPRAKVCWKDVPRSERAKWWKRLFIDHREVRLIVQDAWIRLAYTVRSESNFGILVLAPSGSGKTRFAEEFKANVERVYARSDPERTIVPALLLRVPDPCTPRDFCIAVLRHLGDPEPELRGKRDIVEQTTKMLKVCEVRVVILDNVQDIPTSRGVKGVEQVAYRIRELIDGSTCLWLLLGTDAARRVVDNESQLIKRLPYRANIHYLDIRSDSSKTKFVKLLLRIEKWLPLTESNEELLRSAAGLIFIATEGILDRIRKLLEFACDAALDARREHLVKADFKAAFEQLFGFQVENPFSDDFTVRQLRGKDEPFEYLNAAPPFTGTRRSKRSSSADNFTATS